MDDDGNLFRQNNYSYTIVAENGESFVLVTATSKIRGGETRVVRTYTDAWGLTHKTEVKSGDAWLATTNSYNDYGRLISTTDPNGNTTSYEYDYNSRVISEKNPAGNEKTSQYNAIGQLISETDYMNNTTNYTYDSMGRIFRVTSPLNDTETMKSETYYGITGDKLFDRVYTTDNDYRETAYTYDSRHRLSTVTQDNISYTKYFYDTLGNVIKMGTGLTSEDLTKTENFSDSSAFTTYTYHPYLNKATTVTDPDGTTHNYNYNYFGLVDNQSYTKSNETYGEIIFTYDGFGQLISKTAGDKTETYRYDWLGNPIKIIGENGITNYLYDDMGRLIKEYDDNGIIKNYSYDANSNRTAFQMYTNFLDLQQNLSYEYDALNRMTKILEGTNTIAQYTYNANGNLLTENNVVVGTSYTYNLAGLAEEKTTINTANTVLQADNYTYNLDGNVSIENDKGYIYDSNNRLSQVNVLNGGNSYYSFDLRNNRSEESIGASENSFTYDLNNRLINRESIDTETDYYYDNRGNLYLKTNMSYLESGIPGTEVTSMGESEFFEYDRFNRLTNYTKGANKAEYEYNSSGIRTSKIVDGERTDFVLDGTDVIAEIRDGEVTNYIRGLTGIIYRKDKAGVKTYYVTNNHGDVTKLANASGAIIKEYFYNEFGIESNIDLTDDNPFRYCGEYFDNETGLIYLRARYYDPTIGRFISEDPIRDDLNWYVYCGNNPIVFVDPFGLADVMLRYIAEKNKGKVKYDSSSGETTITIKKKTVKLSSVSNGKITVYMAGENILTIDAKMINGRTVVDSSFFSKIFEIKGKNTTHQVGDEFASMDDAALAWGLTYNEVSIKNDREYASWIYTEIGGSKFKFDTPIKGKHNSCIIPERKLGTYSKALIHSHGSYIDMEGEYFSKDDMSIANSEGCPIYVTTPAGKFMRYNNKSDYANTLGVGLPRDRKAPRWYLV